MRIFRKLFMLLAGPLVLWGGCALDERTDSTVQQPVLGDHGILDRRAQYGITSAGVSGRPLGELVGPISAAMFGQIESDLNAVITAGSFHAQCTQANGCLTFLDQRGLTISQGASFPSNDVFWQKTVVSDLASMFAANKGLAAITLVVADTTAIADARTAWDVLDALQMDGANIALDYSETAAGVGAWNLALVASPTVYTAKAGRFPGLSPAVVAVAGTDYAAGAADVVWSGSTGACSTVFSAQTYEPSALCAGKRIGADIASVAKGLPITFNGSATTFDSESSAAAFLLGRLSLQPTVMATRAAVFGGSAAKVTDVTTGTDAAGHTAVTGTDIATGRGVPAGNTTL